MRAQNVDVRPGDVLLVRTGYATCWSETTTYLTAAGVSKSANLWAADKRVVAVGGDNMAWDSMTERDPETGMTLFGHVHVLVTHGIHIIENLNLEALAAAGPQGIRVRRYSAQADGGDGVAYPSPRSHRLK